MKKSMLLLGLCLAFVPVLAQRDFAVQIRSGNKIVWKETGMLLDRADEIYRQKLGVLTDRLRNKFRQEFNSKYDRWTRAEEFEMARRTTLSIAENNGHISLRYSMVGTSVNFRVTTPDLLPGIGKDRKDDPSVFFTFTVSGQFELMYDSTAGSIRFVKPRWGLWVTSFSSQRLDGALAKDGVESWLENNLMNALTPIFYELDPIFHSFNDYLNTSIKANPILLAELKLDGNQQLMPVAYGDRLLVFQHRYSSTGIAQRAATQEANIVLEERKAPLPPSTIPVSTSPGDLNKKPAAATPRPATILKRKGK